MYSQYYNATIKDLQIFRKQKPTANHLFGYNYELYHGSRKILTLSVSSNRYHQRDVIRRFFGETGRIGYIFVQGKPIYLKNLWDVYIQTHVENIIRYVTNCN